MVSSTRNEESHGDAKIQAGPAGEGDTGSTVGIRTPWLTECSPTTLVVRCWRAGLRQAFAGDGGTAGFPAAPQLAIEIALPTAVASTEFHHQGFPV